MARKKQHPAIRKGMSKTTLSRKIREGRIKASRFRKTGPSVAVKKEARRRGVPVSTAYYKGGDVHLPNKRKDAKKTARHKLSGKTYNPRSRQEWRGDHHKTL